MNYKGHNFNTPIGVMVGVGDDEPFTHIIHESIYQRYSQKEKEWYIAIVSGKGKKIVFNNSQHFTRFPASDIVYPELDFTWWIKVRMADTSPITIEDIKTQLKL